MISICIGLKVCDLQTERRKLHLQIDPTSCFYMDRMDINTCVYLSVVCMWCSLHAGGSPLIVTAQLLSLEIQTPEAERKEGGQVEMKCTVTDTDIQNYFVEWQKDNITLKQGEGTVTSDPKFSFFTGYEMSMVNDELLFITGVHRDDSGIYTCNVIDTSGASGNIAASVHVMLSVLYFPNESFPICAPDGPITSVAGTELNIQCSSEVGNPQVMMEIYQTKYIDAFTSSRQGDMVSMSLALTAHVDYNNVQFVCTITSPKYYPDMSHSCIMGPINVTEPPTTPMTESTHLIIAGAVAGVVVLISIIILIIFCRSRPGLCKMKQSSEDNTSITIPMTTASPRDNNSDPFQANFNKDYGIEHKHNNQNRAAEEVTSPAPESSLSHSGTTLPRRVEVPDSNNLIYTKQQKSTIRPDIEHGVTTITEQSYTNPIFDSEGTKDTTKPFQDHSKTFTKPVAKVQPNNNVPKKPASYRPKSDRTSSTHHDIPITSPSQAPTKLSTGHPQDGKQDTSSPPSDVTYAQVYVPIRQTSSASSSQRPGDDVTYAELDLTSHTTQDDGVKPSSSAVGPITYAAVAKTK